MWAGRRRWGPSRWHPFGALAVGPCCCCSAILALLRCADAPGRARAWPRRARSTAPLHFLVQGKGWEYQLYPLALFLCALAPCGGGPARCDGRVAARPRPLGISRRAVALAAWALLVIVLGARASTRASPTGSPTRPRGWPRSPAISARSCRPAPTVQVLDTTSGGIHALLRLGLRQPTRFIYDFHFFHDVGRPAHPRAPRGAGGGARDGPPGRGGGARGELARASATSAWPPSPSWRARWRPRSRWPSPAAAIGSMRSEAIRSVIRAYDDPIVRAYCWGRFWILRQRFLDEIGQYLPARGRVLDLGCGFGLFSLYYASAHPGTHRRGLRPQSAPHRDGPRGRAPARPRQCPVRGRRRHGLARGGERFDAAYMLDIVHHIPEEAVRPLLDQVAKTLPAGGAPPRQGRGSPAGLQALVHPRARQGDGSGDAGPLLGRRGAAGAPGGRGLRGAPAPDGGRPALPHVLYVGRRRA